MFSLLLGAWLPDLSLDNLYRIVCMLVLFAFLFFMQHRSVYTRRAASLKIHAAKKFKQRNEKRDRMMKLIKDKENGYDIPGQSNKQAVCVRCLRCGR